MNQSKAPVISIVMPVRNEARYIERCLRQIFIQKISFPYEIIIIDSGSTDSTLEIIRGLKNPRIRIKEIPAEQFGHGRTRNLGAHLSKGEYLVFLNGDAFPLNHRWLHELYQEVNRNEKTIAAFSRHIPRRDCHLYMQRDIYNAFPDSGREHTRKLSFRTLLFSTVSCIIRRHIFLRYPFREDIIIAEDQEWVGRMNQTQAGEIACALDSVVIHSHNYTAGQLFGIKKKVARSGPKIHWSALVTWRIPLAIGGALSKFLGDLFYIVSVKGVPVGRKIRQIGVAGAARLTTFAGKYIGWWQSRFHG